MYNDSIVFTEAATLPGLHQRASSTPSLSTDYIHRPPIDTTETIQVSEEAPWDQSGEDLIQNWLDTSKQQAAVHRKQGFRLKWLYKFFGVLSIISASIVFLLSNIKVSPEKTTDDIVHIVVAFFNLLITNLTNFLNYGPKYQLHFEFEGKYSKIAVDLREILATSREYRSPKDRTLAEYKEKVGNLLVNAPET